MPQEELGQLVTGDRLGPRGVLARPLQVADSLGGLVGDMDRGQVPGTEEVGQLGRVSAIGLDAVAALDRDERRGDDATTEPGGLELTVKPVAGGSGLVAAREPLGRPETVQGLTRLLHHNVASSVVART